jgi:NADPH-ferrihemoprotein reductase
LAQNFSWELVNNGRLERQYRLEIIDQPSTVFTGEFGRIGAHRNQRPLAFIYPILLIIQDFRPYDQKNPYLAKIAISRELHGEMSGRSCRHIEFKIDGTKIRYEAGDHVAVFPTNNTHMVEKLGSLLTADLDVVFKLVNVDGIFLVSSSLSEFIYF